ncbi:MAG: hypothetical protein K6G11_06110 [Lachnospiraceae bacterium]|nr:hypothetical protein [Lachnospiraceae bacterium]
MQTEMTAKDKKLLYMLGFIVIIAIFGLGAIRPIYTKMSKTNKEISKVKDDYEAMKMKLMRLETITIYVDSMDKNVDSLSSIYFDVMNSSEIDKYITDKAIKNNLKVSSLNIEMPDNFVLLNPYKYSDAQKELDRRLAAEAEEAEAAAEDGTVEVGETGETGTDDTTEGMSVEDMLSSGQMVSLKDAVNEAGDTSNSGVYAAKVTLNVNGNENKEQQFLNDFINNNPAIRVVSYSWIEPIDRYVTDSKGRIRLVSSKNKTLSITLEMYMYDETSYTSPNETAETPLEGENETE